MIRGLQSYIGMALVRNDRSFYIAKDSVPVESK